MDELEDLKNQIEEIKEQNIKLQKKVDDLYANTLPDSFKKTLVRDGFLRYRGPNVLTYTNPSGREFWSAFFEFNENNTLVSLDNYADTTGVKRVSYVPFTASTSDTITAQGVTFADDQQVRVYTTGNIPGGLSTTPIYYTINSSGNTCKLSTSLGGSAVNITSEGGPYNYLAFV